MTEENEKCPQCHQVHPKISHEDVAQRMHVASNMVKDFSGFASKMGIHTIMTIVAVECAPGVKIMGIILNNNLSSEKRGEILKAMIRDPGEAIKLIAKTMEELTK